MGKIDKLIKFRKKLNNINIELYDNVRELENSLKYNFKTVKLACMQLIILLAIKFLHKIIKIKRNNFHINSKVVFKKVESPPSRKPDYISYANFVIWDDGNVTLFFKDNKKGKPVAVAIDDPDEELEFMPIIGTFEDWNGCPAYKVKTNEVSSKYWYTKKGVYRESSHWGKVAQCQWEIDYLKKGETQVGFAKWQDFKLNNE